MTPPVLLEAVVERKQPDLPRFVVVPAEAIAGWQLSGTTVIEIAINGVEATRRTIKRWDDRRWFLSITAEDCRLLGIDTGDRINLTLQVASADLPDELANLLRLNPLAAEAWGRLTASQQRDLREHVAAAKQSTTRARRAEAALLSRS
ncbi:MAG: Bacteriocin-protection, YdeI or OmpD-Associated [Acidobacteriota bacterium]|jgi:hypothetical protein|nr:Bacteriocin-protection, YdeI or OmpD-Associated [Acidobacteriota bacterium]